MDLTVKLRGNGGIGVATSHKKRPYKTTVDGKTYKESFFEIIKKSSRPLRQSEIALAYWEQRNHGLDEDSEHFVTLSAVQSGASQYLPKLVEDKRIITIDGKFYKVYTREDERAELRKHILKEVDFDCTAVYEVSKKVFAIKVKQGMIKTAARLLGDYFDQDCYGVVPVHGMVLIMFDCGEKKVREHRKDLTAMVEREEYLPVVEKSEQ